jgi:hypothetical protein
MNYPHGHISFHDSQLVYKGINECLPALKSDGVNFHLAGLFGAVYVIAIDMTPIPGFAQQDRANESCNLLSPRPGLLAASALAIPGPALPPHHRVAVSNA